MSHKKIHDTLLELGTTLGDCSRAFGPRRDVDPVRHLIGSAMGWGGNPEKDALYLNVTPDKNDGTTIYQMRIDDVPVEGFWSISVYNAEGYFEKNDQDAYTINNLTAKRAKDGSIHVQFGGTSDDEPINVLPITPGWNYIVRLYRPRAKVLDGSWKFPRQNRSSRALRAVGGNQPPDTTCCRDRRTATSARSSPLRASAASSAREHPRAASRRSTA